MEDGSNFKKPQREYLNNILDDRLQQYCDELTSDVTLNEITIRQKALNRSSLGAKWCMYGYKEENYLKKLKKSLDDFKTVNMEKLLDVCTNQGVSESKLNLNKIKFDKILSTQPEYIQIQKDIEIQEQIVRFITEAKQIISAFSYDINNSKEILKLENI